MSIAELNKTIEQLRFDLQPYTAKNAGSYGKRNEGMASQKGKPQLNNSLHLSLARCMTELKKRGG